MKPTAPSLRAFASPGKSQNRHTLRAQLRSLSLWLVLCTSALGAVACTSSPTGKARPLPPMEAQGMLRNDFAVLIDLREPAPAGAPRESAKNAVRIPLSSLKAESPERAARLQTLPRNKTLAVFAESPELARAGAEQLALLGFQAGHVGTLQDWKQAGGATE